MVKLKWMLTSLALAGALSACGGGSESNGSGQDGTLGVASTNAFNLQSGYQAMVRQGYTKTFNLTGSCTGTWTTSATGASSSPLFEGVAALSSNQITNKNFYGNCGLPGGQTFSTQYYNLAALPVGFSTSGIYGAAGSVPNLPVVAHVGDLGSIATMNLYTDSTKTDSLGYQTMAYVVSADTATTALVHIFSTRYDSHYAAVYAQDDVFRIDANGNWTPFRVVAGIGNITIVGY